MTTKENKAIKASLLLHKDNEEKLNAIKDIEECAQLIKSEVRNADFGNKLNCILTNIASSKRKSYLDWKKSYVKWSLQSTH